MLLQPSAFVVVLVAVAVAVAPVLPLDPLLGMTLALTAFAFAFAFAVSLSYQRHINKYGRPHKRPRASSPSPYKCLRICISGCCHLLSAGVFAKSLFLTWLVC